MNERGRRWISRVGTGALAWLAITSAAKADVTEIRDFAVYVNGKQVGHNQLTITDKKDGTTVVHNTAKVKVKFFITYTYNFEGTETWKQYQLLKLDGNCDDNGRKYSIEAAFDASNNVVRLRKQNQEQALNPNVWTTSYWKLPEARYHNNQVTLLDPDRGEVTAGHLQYIGTEQRAVAGKMQKCYHFRVSGPNPPVDLWFDVYHRLVRQEFVERGHRTIIELVNVRR